MAMSARTSCLFAERVLGVNPRLVPAVSKTMRCGARKGDRRPAPHDTRALSSVSALRSTVPCGRSENFLALIQVSAQFFATGMFMTSRSTEPAPALRALPSTVDHQVCCVGWGLIDGSGHPRPASMRPPCLWQIALSRATGTNHASPSRAVHPRRRGRAVDRPRYCVSS